LTINKQVQDNGEQIIAALGEMHLARCLAILTEDFARIKIKVSSPIVSFRESMVKQLARGVKQHFVQEVAERMVTITVHAVPLPWSIVQFLEQNADKIKRYDKSSTLHCFLWGGFFFYYKSSDLLV